MSELSPDAQQDDKPVVYFDGSCPVCTFEISHYRKLDKAGAIRFEDVSQTGVEIGPDLTQEQAMARFHVRRPDGSLASGAAGFAELWRHVPVWRYFGHAARLPGVTPLLDLVYSGFLKLRPGLVRWLGPKLKKSTETAQ